MRINIKGIWTGFALTAFILAILAVPSGALALGNGKTPPGLMKKMNPGMQGSQGWGNNGVGNKKKPYGQVKKTGMFRMQQKYTLNQKFFCLQGIVRAVSPKDPAVLVLAASNNDAADILPVRVADDAAIFVNGKVADLEDIKKNYSVIVILNPGGNAILVTASSDGDFQADDSEAPEIVKLTPADGAKDVKVGLKKLVATFDEKIYLVNTESYTESVILVRNVTDGKRVGTADIDVDGKELVIYLSRGLEEDCKYTVYMPNNLIRDGYGNKFAGIEKGDWQFITSEDEDDNKPEVVKLKPADGDKDVEVGFNKLVATFDEKIYLVNSESNTESEIQVENVTDDRRIRVSDINVEGKELVIYLSRGLEEDCKYTVYVPVNLFRDRDGNKFAGIDRGEWEFTTGEEEDDDAPGISRLEPGDGKTVYDDVEEVFAAFNEDVRWADADESKGQVFVFNLSKNEMVVPEKAEIDNDQLVIKFKSALAEGSYGVTILAGAIEDMAGNEFNGINLSDWCFRVK